MSRPEFSFIIPARNEGPALTATLRCLYWLKYHCNRDIEIIVVDDASETPLVPLHMAAAAGWCRSPRRLGVARAANVGATLASGKTLIFIDAHVSFEQNFLQRLEASMAQDPAAVFGCTTYMLTDLEAFWSLTDGADSAAFLGCVNEKRYGWALDTKAWPVEYWIPTRKPGDQYQVPYVSACMMAMRRKVFFELGQFDESLIGFGAAQDTEFCARAWAFGRQVLLLPDLICWHYTAPRRGVDRVADNPLEQLDDPHYAGATVNLLRTLFLHLPAVRSMRVLDTAQAKCQELRLPRITLDYVLPTIQRLAWMDARRQRTVFDVCERMTHVDHELSVVSVGGRTMPRAAG